ncbi:MAG: hypothetical protein H6810_06830 [Phycisphaeraceae bacterium]|nr:MAG: hypothetical protein H6810_06830 [Phycisphaeraceae bacterium]
MNQTRTPRSGRGHRRGLAPLVALNAALLAGLGLVEFGPVAWAQPETSRPRGEYTLVGGEIQTGNSNAVYIIDSVNQEMIVLRWEDGRNILTGIGYRDLDADSKSRTQR